jgi:hypothetical protein
MVFGVGAVIGMLAIERARQESLRFIEELGVRNCSWNPGRQRSEEFQIAQVVARVDGARCAHSEPISIRWS